MMAIDYAERNRQNRLRREKEVRRNIFILLSVVCVLIITVIFMLSSISTEATDQDHIPSYKYYKSIEIQSGDTLWSIAGEYMDEHYKNKSEYIKEVSYVNGLENNQITAGNYIIVPYYSTEFVSSKNTETVLY